MDVEERCRWLGVLMLSVHRAAQKNGMSGGVDRVGGLFGAAGALGLSGRTKQATAVLADPYC